MMLVAVRAAVGKTRETARRTLARKVAISSRKIDVRASATARTLGDRAAIAVVVPSA